MHQCVAAGIADSMEGVFVMYIMWYDHLHKSDENYISDIENCIYILENIQWRFNELGRSVTNAKMMNNWPPLETKFLT